MGINFYSKFKSTALAMFALSAPTFASGEAVKTEFNSQASAYWENRSGVANSKTATVDVAGAFKLTNHSVGENLTVKGTAADAKGYTLTTYEPSAKATGTAEGHNVTYSVTPTRGLTFEASELMFRTCRYGTNGGLINVTYSIGGQEELVLQSALVPNRNNDANGYAEYTLKFPKGTIAEGKILKINFYLYGMDAGKQIGYSDITLSGKITGSPVDVETYTLNTTVSPEMAGKIELSPDEDEYDEDTEVTLSAKRNFGYQFVKWVDKNTGNQISASENMTVVMNEGKNIEAVFEAINTYEMVLDVEGGANTYQLTVTPAGTVVDGKVMYEENSIVTLKAYSNDVILFTNWSTGETTSEIAVNMNEDKNITAFFEAADYIVAWDFYAAGNSSKIADYNSTDDNDASALILRNEAGTTFSWLDKSYSKGGYEGLNAAVNWTALTENTYYQIAFNAKDFTDIKVASKLLYNYKAHKIQKVEYSIDGINFTTLVDVDLVSSKTWINANVELPEDANHAEKVYVRWIADYTSEYVGHESEKNGLAISSIYVTATGDIYNDGNAPVLTNQVPASGSFGASASGQVVLTFDKKISIEANATATLGDKIIKPSVTGKTIVFPYTGLSYNTTYGFSIASDVISDLAGNVLNEAISFEFTTMERSEVSKGMYDFIVDGTEGKTIVDAIKAANLNATGSRYRIFVKNGRHYLGNGITTLSKANVSIIGESVENTVLYNKPVEEGISKTATIQIGKEVTNIYMQDLTLENAYDYSGNDGRAVALQDMGTKNIFKNIRLLSYQDTYYSNNNTMRAYFEDCEIHGTVDFICGGGDVVFNRNLIFLEDRTGNVITAHAGYTDWGYVFMDCTIDGYASNQGSYTLGRPWNGNPRTVYLNTKMNVIPTAAGWAEMSATAHPALFAEYKSVTGNGTPVDCSNRKKEFASGKVDYDPVLSDEDAAKFTIENILSGDDQWIPTLATEQEASLEVACAEGTLSWEESKYALLYAVVKNGDVIEFTNTCSYEIPSDVQSAIYEIRSANEMGGLGMVSNSINYSATGINDATVGNVISVEYFSIDGVKLPAAGKGLNIVRKVYDNGNVEIEKTFVK